MIVFPKIEDYITKFSESEPVLLKELREETNHLCKNAHMISGEYQGRLLSLLSKIINPKIVVEIGTFTGYSALCLAEGLHQNGILYTFDKDDTMQNLAKKYFSASKYSNKIKPILGDAKIEIDNINEKIDLAFIDADKKSYSYYFDKILPKMNHGGIILTDNVLWKGKIIEEHKDKITHTLDDYNKKIALDERIEKIILPIRDGLNLIRVK